MHARIADSVDSPNALREFLFDRGVVACTLHELTRAEGHLIFDS